MFHIATLRAVRIALLVTECLYELFRSCSINGGEDTLRHITRTDFGIDRGVTCSNARERNRIADPYAERRLKLFPAGTWRNVEFNQYPGMFAQWAFLNRDRAFSAFTCGSLVEWPTTVEVNTPSKKAEDKLLPEFRNIADSQAALGYHIANENRRWTDSSAV